MLKNLKRASAIALSLAMAIQFGLADSYYANVNSEQPVVEQQEQTQEQEPATVEDNNTAQEQTDTQAEQPVAETQQQPETKSIELSYVSEEGETLQATTSKDYTVDYALNQDANVMLNFDGYTLKDVVINNSQTLSAQQAQSSLNVSQDMTSVKFVYTKNNTEETKTNENTENKTEETKQEEEKTDEDAEADSEKESEYPAFDEVATVGNITVHATANEGVLPNDSKLVAKRIKRKAILNAVEETVSDNDKEVDSAVAIDVTLINKDGNEIQPNGSVNISFENTGVTGEEVNVYHVTDDASSVTEVANNTQSFDANHFSIYVITGENQVALTTYVFKANGEEVSRQIVKTGDTLVSPTAPDVAGKTFVGWYDGETKFENFGTQTITNTETKEITAKYEDALYVYFYNADGTQIMRTEKVADHDEHDFTSVSYEVDSTHKLVGWAATKNGRENIASKIAVPEDATSVNVYAIIKEGYWVSFDSDGGSAIDSEFVLNGDKIQLGKDTIPTKPGYTFDGWYNESSKVTSGTVITSTMTLKAHWVAKEVSYTVIHWWENANDDGYSFHESEELKGVTGSLTSANAKTYKENGTNLLGEKVSDNVFTANTISQKTINGDGSTIVNVYYKRKSYTLHFKERQNSRNDYKTITKKWGQDITKNEWPTYNGNGNWQIKSAGWGGTSRYIAFTSTMPMTDGTLWSTSGNRKLEAYYFVENITGNNYILHHTDVIKSDSDQLTIGNEDCYSIAGFKFEKSNPEVGGKYNGAEFYYTRNSYNIKFMNLGKEDKSVSKKYEENISNVGYTPTRPSSLPSYYQFDGWYANELCEGEKYDFTGKTMPAQNITLYAKWTASKVKFTYDLNTPDKSGEKGSKKVDAGTIASTLLPSTTVNEYTFAGWYYADGNGKLTSEVFDTNTAIVKDTNVIGKWLYNGQLKVKYDAGSEKNATVPTDNNVYAGGAKATVASGAKTTSKKKFLGWKLNGNLYQPGDSFEVNKDLASEGNTITLTAIWGNEESSTTMSYDPGNGEGVVKTVAIKNNESVTLKSELNLGYTAPQVEGKEYYFAGWATSLEDAQSGRATYSAGQTVNVDVNGSNVLYATWVEKEVIMVVANSANLKYNGQTQKVEGFKELTINGYTVSGLSSKAEGKDVKEGGYATSITGNAKVTKDGVDVTDKVIVKVESGKLVIEKRNVTLTSATASKPYDGTPLTDHTVTESGDGFVDGEGATYDVMGSRTIKGTSPNTFTYKLNDGTNANNYTITPINGSLTIIDRTEKYQITVQSNSGNVKYDGNKHEVNGLVTDTFTVNGNEYKVTGLTAHGEGTDADSYDNVISGTVIVKDSEGHDVTDQFNVNTNVGKLVIEQRKVTLTSAKASKPYDGTPLTNSTVTPSGDGFVKGEGATYDVTGSQTIPDTSKNTFTYTLNENTKESNYNIAKVEGDLTVTDRTEKYVVTVSAASGGEKYNGNEQSVGTELMGTTFEWNGASFKIEGLTASGAKGTDVGTYENIISGKAVVKDTDGNDVSKQFKVNTVDGDLTISKRDVTLTSATDQKPYDGTPLTNSTVTETGDGFVTGEGATYTVTGSRTKPGTSDNSFEYQLNENTKVENYNITQVVGKLTVLNRSDKYEITVTAKSDEMPYDGKKHEVDGLVTDTFVVDGNEYKVTGLTAHAEGTDAGTYENKIKGTAKVLDAQGNDVTSEFTVTLNDGNLTINKREVKLTSASASKKYDGLALTKKEVNVTSGSFAEGEGFTFDVTGSQTVPGSSGNTFTYSLNSNTQSKNYIITAKEGTLTVEDVEQAYETTVTAPSSLNNVYDGTKKSAGNNLTGTSFTWNGHQYTIEGLTSENVTMKDAGTYDNKVMGTAVVRDSKGNDVTSQFTVIKQDGSLVINKRVVKLKSATDSKLYDGTALTRPDVEYVKGSFVEGEVSNVRATGTVTNVSEGERTNTITYTTHETFKADNYDISKDEGKLSITSKSIVPDTPDTPENEKIGITVSEPQDHVYDGKEHKEVLTVTDTKTITNTVLVEGTDYTVSYDKTDFTNVTGNITIIVTGVGNYSGSFTKTYKITKREVTLKSASLDRVYNGTALINGKTPLETESGFVEGESTRYTFTGSQTEVGESDNTFTVNWDGKAKESNYNVTIEFGTLKVTEQSIVPGPDPENPDPSYKGIQINSPSDVPYNGQVQKWAPTVTDAAGKVLAEGTDYTVSYDKDDFTNVTGAIKVTITGKGNYTGSVTRNYQILPREYTVTTDGDSKTYDGEPLTVAGYKVENVLEKDGYSFRTTGSQTVVGESNNTYTMTWNNEVSKNNYTLAGETLGKLVVTKQSIVPDPQNPESYKGIQINDPVNITYDGQKHKWTPTVTDKNGKALESGKDYTVSYDTDDFKDVKTITVTITGKGNYTGTVVKTYQITPAPITIKTDGVTRPYNGKALTAGGNVTGIVSGETYTFKTTGSQTKVGSSDNTYELKWNGTAKKSNYEITSEEIGKLVVTENAEEIVVTTTGGKFTYDGNSHGATVSVSQLPEGYTLETATSSASATDVTDGIKATCDTLVIRNAEGEDVTSKLKITKVDGTIVITPAILTITTPNANKTYDGNALTAEGSISGFVNNETATFKTTGSQTKVGESKNTYELTWDGTAKKSNYTVSETVGTLTVTAQSINPKDEKTYGGVTVNNPENKEYNGQDQTWTPEVKDSEGKALNKSDYKVSYSKDDRTNVTGTITVTIEGQGNYSGTVTRTYEITPKEYTVTTDSDSKTYDGTALTAGGKVNGLVKGETVEFKTTGSQTEQGSSNNTYDLKWTGTATKSNYKHGTDSIGTLTVSKQSIDPGTDPEKPDPDYDGIEINYPSDVVYDGTEHKWIPSVTDKDGQALDESAYTVSYDSNDFTDVGTITVTITGVGNYTGTVTRTYKITPRKYTITTLGGTKVYDGRALTNFGMVEGIVSGETYSFRTTGSQTEVGSSDNTYEFEWGTAKKSNYVLDKESIGKLVVTAKSIIPDTPDTPDSSKTGITVSDPSDSMYDGTEHREVLTVKDSKTGKELVSGTDYDVAYSNDLVNAGTVTITVIGKGNYSGSFTKTYKITKRNVTLTSASATKTYDGTALTNNSIEVSGDGFVKGEGATYVVTGTQTNVGNSANSFEYTLNENTLASNYSVTKVVGTLRITRATAPVTPATPSTPSTPGTSGTTTLPSVVQRIVNVFNPTPAPSENVETNKTPKANRETETVEEDYTPKATRKYYWALINLICAILTVLFGLLLLISKRHKNKDDDDEEEDDETKQATKDTDEDEEEEEPEKKRGLFTRVLAVLIAIVSVVLFLLTEDMSLPWVWVDKWTVWMVVIGLVQIVVFFVGRKWKKVDDDEEDEEQAQQA